MTVDPDQTQTPSKSDVGTNSVNALAKEHVLCPTCQQSVDAAHLLQDPTRGSEPFRSYTDVHALEISSSEHDCHLCSLFLGTIRHPATTIGPITIALQVSRSGGITLLITSGESQLQRVGELAIVPVENVGDHDISDPADAKFTFPIQKTLDDARLAKSIASEASFALAQVWLQQCLHRHAKCCQAAASARTSTVPSRLMDVGVGVGTRLRVVATQGLNAGILGDLKYLTLSHCWGGAHILRLLNDNVDQLTVEIPMDALPKTFQHAMIVTHRLGYVALCLVELRRSLTGTS